MKYKKNSVDSVLNQLPTESMPLSAEEQKRILSLALQKTAGKRVHAAPARPRSRYPVRAAAFLAAACVLSAGAFAAPFVGDLVSGRISFFANARPQSETNDPLDALRGNYNGQQQTLESHNMAVGQSVTQDGIQYTLDTVSMDAAALDCFFTISGENAVSRLIDASSIYPEWEQLRGNSPVLWAQIAQEEALFPMQSDLYRQGEDSFRYWLHYQLPAEPQGDTITLQLFDSAFQNSGSGLHYTVQLNGGQVRAGARRVDPAVLDFGLSDAILGSNPITLDSLYFGTGCGTLVAHSEAQDALAATFPGGISDEEAQKRVQAAGDTPITFAGSMILTDDTGRELLASCCANSEENYTAYTLPAENASSITFTPVYHQGEYSSEYRTVSTAEMREGIKIATSDAGGYILQNFEAQGSALTWQMVPYGYAGYTEMFPQDEEYIDTNSNSYALRSSTVDPCTGIISQRIDYYTADAAQVAKISEFQYIYEPGYTVDASRAITLPLVSE